MVLNILHFSKTPLAGAPIRLVRALQEHSTYNVHLVDSNRWGIYDQDIVFLENPELVMELAEDADIIHFHNYLDYDSKDFFPINFQELHNQGKIFVRQFHSHPQLVAREMKTNIKDILDSPIPSLVIAQFQERYYPNARVVPNIIPQNDPQYKPSKEDLSECIFFSPSAKDNLFTDRWNTKGAYETMKVLEKVSQKTGFPLRVISGKNLNQVMSMKRQAKTVIDELATGSYHLSGLEGLSLGKPVFAYLDPRVDYVLREISRAKISPFLNIRLEDTFDVMVDLLNHPDVSYEIGKASRKWIEKYWSDHELIKHYEDVYQKLLVDPTMIRRQESLSLTDTAMYYRSIDLPDRVYSSRLKLYDRRFIKTRYKIDKNTLWMRNTIQSLFVKIKNAL